MKGGIAHYLCVSDLSDQRQRGIQRMAAAKIKRAPRCFQ